MRLATLSDKIVFSALKNIKYGKIVISNYDGKTYSLGSNDHSLQAKLVIKKPGFTIDILNKGSVGLAESYMRGDFETDNLTNLIEITAKNIKKVHKISGVFDFPFINFFKNKFIKNTKKRSKENISKHYDLGNEFFSLWLDKTLTYSSAIFDNQKIDLETAQINKYKKLSSLVKPNSGDAMLEIGCGWGGFAEYVGKNYDVKLDCITISKKQYEYTKERIFKNGLNEKVNIEMLDYRDVKKKYNSIASIEMIEAVGENYLESYFKKIKENLLDNGKAAIQAITIDDNLYERYKTKQDFIQKYIFPGGMLPSKKALERQFLQVGLKKVNLKSFGYSYSKTLRLWHSSFNSVWEDIASAKFDDRFKRMWNFYLASCAAVFQSKTGDVIQVTLKKS